MQKITILHLSDIHLTEEKLPELKTVFNKLMDDIDLLIKERDVKPQMLFLTGDLINRGSTGEKDFKLLSTHLVEPLISRFRISQDLIFTIPGNHEVNRNKVSEALEHGLDALLDSQIAIQDYHTKIKTSNIQGTDPGHTALLEKLSEYNRFQESYMSENLIHQCFFFTSFKFSIGDITIGLVAFNSAWRCAQHVRPDERKLVIGLSTVDLAASTISDCDFKIALCHHPFTMLADWDAKEVERRVAREFDILFTGHTHESDLSYFKQTYGKFYVSTGGCLFDGGDSSFYSIVELNFSQEKATSHLRKLYRGRGEFDQETEKAKNGIVQYDDFRPSDPAIAEKIALQELRDKLYENRVQAPIVNPLEGIVEISLGGVFVEPVISDTPTYERDSDNAKFLTLTELLEGPDNIVFFGRSEYGKTTLLSYAQTLLLSEVKAFEAIIPVFISFEDLPNNNPEGIIHLIRRNLLDLVPREKIGKLVDSGSIIVLLDDFNDTRCRDREKKSQVFLNFVRTHPEIRFIVSSTEHLSQTPNPLVMELCAEWAINPYYIGSFNTGRIRQLLRKIEAKKALDVEKMLEQILFYFEQLQIPVTPLAVTLFIGVLFRDRGKKNIQNEAYLIENYLESILEKINPDDTGSELDFREKESFLAYIAFRFFELGKWRFSTNEFAREKLTYFEELEEDVPKEKVFDDFFKKGILIETDGQIEFKFRFWFDFFLAKAMEKNDLIRNKVLDHPSFLRFATALGYKAGLSRNDAFLLKTIDDRASEAFSQASQAKFLEESLERNSDDCFAEIAKSVDSELREKNCPESVDNQRDAILKASARPPEIQDDNEDIIQLITLHSDILRNTREVASEIKLECLRHNVAFYVSLMWMSLKSLQENIETMDPELLEKFLFRGKMGKKTEIRLQKVVEQSHRMMFQILPVSLVLYMTDHLGNPKLARSVSALLDDIAPPIERLFRILLLCRLSIDDGLKSLELFLSESTSAIFDYIAFVFLRVYASEHVVDGQVIERILNILDLIRKRYSNPSKTYPPFVRDNFRPSLKQQFANQHKRFKK